MEEGGVEGIVEGGQVAQHEDQPFPQLRKLPLVRNLKETQPPDAGVLASRGVLATQIVVLEFSGESGLL